MNRWIHLLITNTSTPLVDLLFHLPVILSLLVTSLAVSLVRKKRHSLYSKRVFIGLDFLLAGQFLLIILHGLNWLYLLPVNFFLPPLDRAVTVFSYIWIIWMWTAILPGNRSDRLLAVLIVAVLAVLGFSIYWWNLVWMYSAFNLSPLDWNWQFFSASVLAAGIILILFNRHKRWGIGLLLLLINLAGHTFHIVSGNSLTNYSIEVRLAQLLSFPLLIFIAARFKHRSARSAAPGQALAVNPLHLQPIADPSAVISWIKTAAVDTISDEVYPLLSESIAHTMQADVCLLASIHPAESGKLTIQGFDRYHARIIPSREIKQNFFPTISASIQRGDALYLSASGSLPVDAYILSEILGFEQSGDILMSPVSVQNQLWGSLLVLSPYTLRFWSPDEQSFFHATARKVAEILDRVSKPKPSGMQITPQAASDDAAKDGPRSALARIQAASLEQGPGDEGPSPSPDLILALGEINRLKAELRQSRDRLMILELDTAITEQELEPGQTDAWQSEIDQWIRLEQTEPLAETQASTPPALSIEEVISQAVDDLQSEIAGRNLTLQLNLSDITRTSSEDRQVFESLLTGLVNHIVNTTPANGFVRISAQPTTLAEQPAAIIELDGIPAEHTGPLIAREALDPDVFEKDQSRDLSQLEEMKTITASLQGSFSLDGEPGGSTMIKVILPDSTPSN